MSIFTIIAGVNGVGKSSLTGLLKGERSDLGIIVDVDAISAKCGGNIKGGKKAIQMINDCLIRKSISHRKQHYRENEYSVHWKKQRKTVIISGCIMWL